MDNFFDQNYGNSGNSDIPSVPNNSSPYTNPNNSLDSEEKSKWETVSNFDRNQLGNDLGGQNNQNYQQLPPKPVNNNVNSDSLNHKNDFNKAKYKNINYVSEHNINEDFNSKKKSGGRVWFKLFLLLSIPMLITAFVASFFVKRIGEINFQTSKGIVAIEPIKDVNWKDIGVVFEPLIDIPVKTLSGYKEQEFLLDSGAVISSLPRDWAEDIGTDIDMMKRLVFKGFGGTTSFAYLGDMTILIGEEEVGVPVVFTEAEGTKSLIGRKGFFQDYSVYFNHNEKQIEIRK